MKRFRGTRVVSLAVLAVLSAGCAAGDDTSGDDTSGGPQGEVSADAAELDGVRFDVRRDPG